MKRLVVLIFLLSGALIWDISPLAAQQGTCADILEMGKGFADRYEGEQRAVLQGRAEEAMTGLFMGAYTVGFRHAMDMIAQIPNSSVRPAAWFEQTRLGTFQIEFLELCKEEPTLPLSDAALTVMALLADRYGPLIEFPSTEK